MAAYVFNYLLLFFVPGFVVARAAGFGGIAPALALPFSYLFLVVHVFAARLLSIQVDSLGKGLYAAITALVLFELWRVSRRRAFKGPTLTATGFTWGDSLGSRYAAASIPVLLFLAIAAYLILVGPYTEVPSDFWRHVGKVQREYLAIMDGGAFTDAAGWRGHLGKEGAYWYAIQALILQLSGMPLVESLSVQSVLSSLILLGFFFWFSIRVVEVSGFRRDAAMLIAAFAVFFFVAHHGTNVFAFVRYYTFGPVFVNYAVLFVFLALFLDFLRHQECRRAPFLIAGAAMMVLMAVVHLQEALFAMVIVYGTLLVVWACGDVDPCDAQGGAPTRPLERRSVVILLGISTVLLTGGWIYAHYRFHIYDPLRTGHLIEINAIVPFLRNMFVLDPTWQFYETFTPWGYLVLLAFVVSFRRFRSNPFLVAGMASPLLTVFNPLFTDLFLRLSLPWILWRFLFMVPLAIVAAILFYQAVRSVVESGRPAKRMAGAVMALALLGLLFPIETTYFDSPYSRLQTLRPVAPGNDHRNWADLFDYLNGLKRSHYVMTDPITGYMVRALTPHREDGVKFDTALNPGYRRLVGPDYRIDEFLQFKGSLIIVNLRAGAHSRTGEMSRHWYGHQLDLPRYYPPTLVEFINSNPRHFRKKWESREISVFEIT